MKIPVFSEKYTVRSCECGADGALRPQEMLNFFQEAASDHAHSLGFDFPVIDAATGARGAWVLAQFRIAIGRLPRWRDTVAVETFPHTVKALFAHRDFLLRSAAGETLAEATSRWMVMDPATRKAVRVPACVAEFEAEREPLFAGGAPFPPLRYPEAPERERECKFRVMRSQIDLNAHVNNVHYATWMLESVPSEETAGARLAGLELCYRGETRYGESVSSRCAPDPDAGAGTRVFLHRVCTPDGASDHLTGRSVWVES